MSNTEATSTPARKKRIKRPPSAFNMRLRTERLRAKLSQQRLAALVGIHPVTLNCLETGRAQAPSWAIYQKLLHVLPNLAGSVDVTKLLGWVPAEGVLGSGVTRTPQMRLLKAVATLTAKGVLRDVQELLDAAHAEGIGVSELLSVVTTT